MTIKQDLSDKISVIEDRLSQADELIINQSELIDGLLSDIKQLDVQRKAFDIQFIELDNDVFELRSIIEQLEDDEPESKPFNLAFIQFDEVQTDTSVYTDIIYIREFENGYLEIDEDDGWDLNKVTLALVNSSPSKPFDVESPVDFTIIENNFTHRENIQPYHLNGDFVPYKFLDTNTITVSTKNYEQQTFTLKINRKDKPPTDSNEQNHKLQVNPWESSIINVEEPFNNLLMASGIPWVQFDENWNPIEAHELIKRGIVDETTGYPVKGADVSTRAIFGGSTIEYFDGEWVLDWEGDANVWLQYQPNTMFTKNEPNRIEFTRDFKNGNTKDHIFIRVNNIKTPISNMRLYRKENEESINRGEIFNPKYVESISKYDVLRTMDLQNINRCFYTSADRIQNKDFPFYGYASGMHNIEKHGMPLEPLFVLANKTNTDIWLQAPGHFGYPDKTYLDNSELFHNTQLSAETIIEKCKEEFKKYAFKLLEAAKNSNYPKDRLIYISILNEVWNFAQRYYRDTNYFRFLARTLYPSYNYKNDYNHRLVYGYMIAIMANAIEEVNKDYGFRFKYVIEGQAASPETIKDALIGASHHTNFDNLKSNIVTSVSSYWGAIHTENLNLEDLDELEDYHINGPNTDPGTLNGVLENWMTVEYYSKEFGVHFIGAYEGGCHFLKPHNMSNEKYTEFVWGKRGANINIAVNKTLIENFSDIIISNYVIKGPIGGQPWFEGEDDEYAESWKNFYNDKKL